MATPDPVALATSLALVHRSQAAEDGPRLVDYAESARDGEWTLRSALVRVAQPEPVRASAVLELVRRTDAALAPHRKALGADTVPTVPGLSPSSPDPAAIPPDARILDARVADLARVAVRFPEGDAVVAAYAETEALDADELALVPLLAAAAQLDELAAALATWARSRPGPPPVDLIDDVAGRVFDRLARAGVAPERGPSRRR